MSEVAQPSVQDRRPAGNLALNFSSNNPFRRAASPSSLSPATPNSNLLAQQQPQANPSPRPTSTNPFLDNYQPIDPPPVYEPRNRSPQKMVPSPDRIPRKPAANGDTVQLMNQLTLADKSTSDRNVQRPIDPARARNLPIPANGHRPQKSQDEQLQRNRDKKPLNVFDELDTFGPPIRASENRRPQRRNSETSVIDVKDLERKRDNEARRERDPSSKDSRSREHRSGRSKKTNRRLDIIDRLDVTGIYGQGTFHHDGPFDACNPHRNRKGARATPMQAFPVGSANNALGGSGPVNRNLDLDRFHGRGADVFNDFNLASRRGNTNYDYKRAYPVQTNTFDPKSVAEEVHGEESAGLGTSTFFEGTPAPRSALQRRDSDEANRTAGGGLQRKKSLAQKFRGISRPRPGDNGKITSPESQYVYEERSSTSPMSPPTLVQSAGGRGKMIEVNPFFSQAINGDKESETKQKPNEEVLEVQAELARQNRSRTLSSTASAADGDGKAAIAGGTGLIGRVKSLKGRKPRAEKADQ